MGEGVVGEGLVVLVVGDRDIVEADAAGEEKDRDLFLPLLGTLISCVEALCASMTEDLKMWIQKDEYISTQPIQSIPK